MCCEKNFETCDLATDALPRGLAVDGRMVPEQEQRLLRFPNWTKAEKLWADYLPMEPETKGLCLPEAIQSILSHIDKEADYRIRGPLKACGEVQTIMKALRAHARELLPDALADGDADLAFLPWHLLRSLTTFVAININVVMVQKDGITPVLQVGPMTEGTKSFELCCVGLKQSRGGIDYCESHCLGARV